MKNREELFQLLQSKDWENLSSLLYDNYSILKSDPIVQFAINLYEKEFFSETYNLEPSERLISFKSPGVLIESGRIPFSGEFVATFIDEKLKLLKQTKCKTLFNFASSHQHRPIAKDILAELKESKPEIIADGIREKVSISANSIGTGKPKITSLFKSPQEQNFFEGVRLAFPTFHPYPNVALNSVIDFDSIKGGLNSHEREYFFKALIDCVVFDANQKYQPICFIELDSSFHNSEKAIKNDKMKNAIFNAANAKLIRIRAHDRKETTTDKFRQLVTEIIRNPV